MIHLHYMLRSMLTRCNSDNLKADDKPNDDSVSPVIVTATIDGKVVSWANNW